MAVQPPKLGEGPKTGGPVRNIRRKLVHLVGVLLVVSFLTFLLTNLLPGGPERAILGTNATPEAT